MATFENRLLKKFTPQNDSPTNKSRKQLKGEELVNFVKAHRSDFDGNGDLLCVEAGYGNYSKDGNAKCNFKPFIKELSKVMDLEDKKT